MGNSCFYAKKRLCENIAIHEVWSVFVKRANMTFKDLEFVLELNGVMRKDVDYVLDFSRKNGIDKEEIDDELSKLGYERIFENGLDDALDDDEDDYDHVEKFRHRHKFNEDYD